VNRNTPLISFLAAGLAPLLLAGGCGSKADDLGIAGECTSTEDCPEDTEPPLECLTNFKGGYCGLSDCGGNEDCPEDSICVTHEGSNYCFRTCVDKAECNANRSADNEANCSANITRTDEGTEKACVPPSSG